MDLSEKWMNERSEGVRLRGHLKCGIAGECIQTGLSGGKPDENLQCVFLLPYQRARASGYADDGLQNISDEADLKYHSQISPN